jgi:4,5:9,10-diseco-3-hydroxy-5,9,17-trioxoandrosta-1(10),2-diene-4-oate hydrolase
MMEHQDKAAKKDMLNFSVRGVGRPVVLVHGLASSLHEWDSLTPLLVESGWQAVACDLLNHGDSPQEQMCCDLQGVFESLVAWIAGLDLGESFVLVGHSLGGYLSLQYAQRFPEKLQSLVLIDPLFDPEQIPRPVLKAPQMLDLGQRMLHAAPERMVESVINMSFEPYSPMPAAARRQKTHDLLRASKLVTRLVRGVEPLTPGLGQVRLPTLVVWGMRDRLLAPKLFPRLVAALPDARAYPLAKCGHHPHLERAEEVNRVILEFLIESADRRVDPGSWSDRDSVNEQTEKAERREKRILKKGSRKG